MLANFRPRLLDSLSGYTRTDLLGDVAAGVTVGVLALPLAMAFAIASGLKPEAGIFTAIVAGFVISALGGSRVQIGGPAGAFIVVVYAIVERYGVANLLLSTLFAGILLFAMGLFRMGNLIRFVPVSIVIGFTNGIAVLILLSQVRDFFGLQVGNLPADFFAQIAALARHAQTANAWAVAYAVASLALIAGWSRIAGRFASGRAKFAAVIPGTVVTLLLATLVSALLSPPIDTIGTRFGGIPQTLPRLALPDFDWVQVKLLFAPTLTIALLGAVESLLCARIADGLIDDRHDPNQELMAQGIANVVSPLLGGFCATGTIARTVTNVRSGARSPIAGMVHALTLLLIILVAAPLAQHIPLATLAAILVFVAWNMGAWHEFGRLRQFSYPYRITLLTTFALTVLIDLTVAVEVGVILSCLFFITRISGLTRIEALSAGTLAEAGLDPAQVEVHQVRGSLFFGAVSKLEPLLDPRRARARVTVLDLTFLLSMDNTGLEALETLYSLIQRQGGTLVLAGLTDQPLQQVRRGGFASLLGVQNMPQTLADALERARRLTMPARAAVDDPA
jgi:SulP family sulfate permease